MATKDNGGDAFPMSTPTDIYPGMTLRDWFAGQALAGMMAQEWGVAVADALNAFQVSHGKTVAGFSYQIADAMIAERQKGGAE